MNRIIKASILIFPSEIWSDITCFLDGVDVTMLILIGSKQLNVILLRNRGITELNYPICRLHLHSGHDRKLSAVQQFSFISSFCFDLSSPILDMFFATFKITVFPPTLTKLRIRAHRNSPEIIFHKATLQDLVITERNNAYNLHSLVKQRMEEWLPISEILPNLRHLELVSSCTLQSTSLLGALSALPLTHLTTNLFEFSRQKNCINLAKFPSLTELACPHFWGTLVRLETFPHDLVSLVLPDCCIYLSQISILNQLQVLIVTDFKDNPSVSLSSLPRSLRVFDAPYFELNLSDIPHLPSGLTSLFVRTWPTIESLNSLPSSIVSFSVSNPINSNEGSQFVCNSLSRNLVSLRLHVELQTIDDVKLLSSHLLRLTRLDLHASRFYDYWTSCLPKQLIAFHCAGWFLTGFFVAPSVTRLDLFSLLDSFSNFKLNDHGYPRLELKPVKYLGSGIKEISPSIKLDPELRVADLPKGLSTYPSCVPIGDNEDLDHVSPNAKRVWINGIMRYQSWLKLPPSIHVAKGGSVIYELDDVEKALRVLRDFDCESRDILNRSKNTPASMMESSQVRTNEPNQQITRGPLGTWFADHLQVSTESISFPWSIALAMQPDALQRNHSLSYLLYTSEAASHAIFDQRHFRLLPASVTTLKLRAPPKEFQVEFTCGLDELPLPSSITHVTIENGPLRRCHLLPHMLPVSLVHLRVFEEISDTEMSQLQHLINLESLEVMKITGSIPIRQLLPSLPLSLTRIRLIATNIPSESFHLLPPNLKSLVLENKQDVNPVHLLELPHSITYISFANKKGLCKKIREIDSRPWTIKATGRNIDMSLSTAP